MSWFRPFGVSTVSTRGVNRCANVVMRPDFLADAAKFAISCFTRSRLAADSFDHAGQCTAMPAHVPFRASGLNRLEPGPGECATVNPSDCVTALPHIAGQVFICACVFAAALRPPVVGGLLLARMFVAGSRTKYAGE